MSTNQNQAMKYTPTFLERVGHKLFPSRDWDRDCDPENKAKDIIVTYVTTELSVLDRVRSLLSGRLETEVRIATENVVGGTRSVSHTTVRPWKFMQGILEKGRKG